MTSYDFQKQPSIGVLRKRCSENIPQIYRRTPMPKCDFNKVALFLRTLLGGLLLLDFPVALIIVTAKTQDFNVRIFVLLCALSYYDTTLILYDKLFKCLKNGCNKSARFS